MLITFEGLEGVGKTTLAKLVSTQLKATYLKSPPPEMNTIREYISESRQPGATFYFYLSGLCLMQPLITNALSTGPVIVDRYIDSTIAYHHFGEVFEAPSYAHDMIRAPNLRVLITCPEAQRTSRIEARGLHIFERIQSNDANILRFFASRSDLIFENTAPIEQSMAALSMLINQRLR